MRPSDDPGHKAAEELLQQKQDSHYGDMAGSKTYRQILIEKYPDRKDEIEAFDYPGLDMLKADDYYIKEISFPGSSWVCLANFLEMMLECVKYYQEKLDECEQMYQDDMGVGNYQDNWTYCLACYVRRNHIYDPKMEAWRCEFCGVVNNALTQFKKVAKEVAEENPKEE